MIRYMYITLYINYKKFICIYTYMYTHIIFHVAHIFHAARILHEAHILYGVHVFHALDGGLRHSMPSSVYPAIIRLIESLKRYI